jgi:diguanylate cyclase (GGDEF)-like protein
MDDPVSRPGPGVRHEQPTPNTQTRRDRPLRRWYLFVSVVLITLYPLLPSFGRHTVYLLASLGTIPTVLVGMRRISPNHRRFWVVLLTAVVVLNVAILISLLPGDPADTAGRLLDAAGNFLLLAAALVLVSQQTRGNVGSIIDTSIAALALGGLFWDVVLHRGLVPPYETGPAKLALFVVVFALSGILGALAQMLIQRPIAALRPLIVALALALVGDIVLAVTANSQLNTIAAMMLMGAYTAVGLFGLDPTAGQLLTPAPTRHDRLSLGRLAFLGLAVAIVPIVVGAQQLAGGKNDALVLIVSSATIATLVMVRIGQLSVQRDQAERALRHEATHDSLTGLPNRREFVTQLSQELASGHDCALIFCDLDRFKAVNDRFGHVHGDEVLIEVARRLRDSVRANDLVCRLGGDEFVILLRNGTPDEVEAVNRRIVEALARPVLVSDKLITVGGSTGTAFAVGGVDPEELIMQADHAMYSSKTNVQSEPAN